ncbi:hypothetical protein LZ32DRAFT_607432 [Colletotrichum eremochloae]|nr:hypothetical protein LZ32DRAFT_607432 [Colletotrichum eremochloae]
MRPPYISSCGLYTIRGGMVLVLVSAVYITGAASERKKERKKKTIWLRGERRTGQ